MNILSFDASTELCAAALGDGETCIQRNAHGRDAKLQLHCMIADLLRESGLQLQDLDAIAYGRGPGSFIGVRIAAAVAQSIACASGRPLLGVSSLAAVAQTAFDDSDAEQLLAVLDARKGEWYYGYYRRDQNDLAVLQGEEGVSTFDRIPGLRDFDGACRGNADTIAGVTNVKHCEAHYVGGTFPTAPAMLKLAVPMAAAKQWTAPADAHPVYLRNQVVG